MALRIILLFGAWLQTVLLFGQNGEDSLFIRKIFDEALTQGRCYENLRQLCANGPRLSGSAGAERAVELMASIMQKDGIDQVVLQPVMVPVWHRGNTTKVIAQTQKQRKSLHATALGGSVGTGPKGVSATVVEVQDFDELAQLGEAGIRGKLVFFNRPMDPKPIHTFVAYGACVNQRHQGAAQAARYGAAGVLVRSMSHKLDHQPHTGSMAYDPAFPKIPAAAISTADAEWLSQALKQGTVNVKLQLSCRELPDALSHNVIGEWPGKNLSEIILVGGHLDAWDNSEGAHDDGAGCVHSIEALRILKSLGYIPNRTLRAVLFMNEENGLKGGLAYADSSARQGLTHLAAIESDRGGFSPRGFFIDHTPATLQRIQSWKDLLEPYGLHDIKAGGSGADISPLKYQNTVLIGFVPDSQRYFDYHHAPSDSFEAVNKRELELGAASLAALIYLIDKYGFN